jgi:hypothetical protein
LKSYWAILTTQRRVILGDKGAMHQAVLSPLSPSLGAGGYVA